MGKNPMNIKKRMATIEYHSFNHPAIQSANYLELYTLEYQSVKPPFYCVGTIVIVPRGTVRSFCHQ
jgi:hypothetical protein